MQAKISIQLIAPDKAIKPSCDLKYVFDSANFRLGHYIVLCRFAKPEEFYWGMQEHVERVNAQKSLILKETETYYTEGTLNTWMSMF